MQNLVTCCHMPFTVMQSQTTSYAAVQLCLTPNNVITKHTATQQVTCPRPQLASKLVQPHALVRGGHCSPRSLCGTFHRFLPTTPPTSFSYHLTRLNIPSHTACPSTTSTMPPTRKPSNAVTSGHVWQSERTSVTKRGEEAQQVEAPATG